MELSELKVIVTGAAQGMGRHFTQRLAEAGASVAAADVQEHALADLAEAAAAWPGQVVTQVLDVTDTPQIERFIDFAHGALGGLNGLINNAGIIRDGLLVKKQRQTGDLIKLSDDDWGAVLAVNLTGATMMVRETVARMIATDARGVIVNMSSIARVGNRGQSNYSAAKAAMTANTRTWAHEFGPFGIRVGAVAPGLVDTPMTAGMNQKALDRFVAQIPAGRIGRPDDIWRAVRFVIECDYFNGRTIDVDGGFDF